MEPECNKSARDATNYCSAHGGRMLENDLLTSVFVENVIMIFEPLFYLLLVE